MSTEKQPTVYQYTFRFIRKNGDETTRTVDVASFVELEVYFAQAQEWIDKGNGTVKFRGHDKAWTSEAKWSNACKWFDKKMAKALVPA